MTDNDAVAIIAYLEKLYAEWRQLGDVRMRGLQIFRCLSKVKSGMLIQIQIHQLA